MTMMLLAATLALQIQPSPPAVGNGSGWERVHRGEAHVAWLHRGSIGGNGTRRAARGPADFANPHPNGATRTFYLQEVDCQRRVLILITYVNYGADGRRIDSYTFPADSRRDLPTRPDSQGGTLVQMVCD